MKHGEEKKFFELNFLKWRLKNVLRLFLCACLGLSYFHPQALNLLLASNFAAAVFIFLARFKLLPEAKDFSKLYLISSDDETQPFVSIHVPMERQDPFNAIKALERLEKLDYQNYEVIALSYNTQNEELWKPVRKFCRKRSSLFKFKNMASLPGRRAQALNQCLKMSDPRAKHILTMNPDYCVTPHILKKGVECLEETGKDFLQFPLIYSHGINEASCLEIERSQFYQTFMRCAQNDRESSPLLTGALSLVHKRALVEVGGWCEESAEETKTALKLIKRGFQGVYDHSLIGRGVMPKDLATLRQERNRLARESAETLFSMSINDFAQMGKRKAGSVLLQLTAWQDFLFIPLVYFCLQTLDLFLKGNLWEESFLASPYGATTFAGGTIIVSLYFKLLFFLQKLSSILPTKKIFAVYFTHFGLGLESNLGWIASLRGKARHLLTANNKTLTNSNFAAMAPHALLAAAATLSSIFLFQQNNEVAAITPFFSGMVTMIGAVLIHLELKRAH